jgi:TPR repeat protein
MTTEDLRRRASCMLALAFVLYSPLVLGTLADGLDALKHKDYAAAVKELRPLADKGDAEAQYRMGLMYEYGAGVPADKAQMVAWLRKSAAQGHAAAECELGILYSLGEGVPHDDAQAVQWFRKSAEHGNPTAQYNLGLLIAKGASVPVDKAQAVAWFRKAADQGLAIAQFKLGVAYDNGEGVAKDDALAYASYAIAARNGSQEALAPRDAMAMTLAPAQLADAKALVAAWEPGKPMPMRVAATASPAPAAAAAPDKCSASGALEGERFSANHCAVALYGDQHSVALWFNEDAIAPDEASAFQLSSNASDNKGGKPRTMVIVMFCPGGGGATASASAVKNVDFNSTHGKAPLAGLQRVLRVPAELKVERMSGEVKPGGRLAGTFVGNVSKTNVRFDFDVTLPARDSAAGMTCTG